jgi:hypothetical protein
MDNIISDFSNPPQWVLDLYSPDNIPPHVLVTKAEAPDTYVIRDVDFHAVNLFTFALANQENLPTKGEAREFTGSPRELYDELTSLESEVITGFSMRKVFREHHDIPMAFGHSSDFSTPALAFADYKAFLSWEKAFAENPEQAGVAYEFINQHPMFWYMEKSKRRDGTPMEPRLVTGRGWDRLAFEVFNKEDKETGEIKTTVTIETGPGNYHDLNLDVWAPSFDAAIVEMAKKIQTHYDSHGGFTDKRKKEPNDNFFKEWDKEEGEAEEASE